MTPKKLNSLLKLSTLNKKEKAEAWKIYKIERVDEAIAFVNETERRVGFKRKQLKLKPSPIPYRTWGESFIEPEAKKQMKRAAQLPIAVAGALMPDAHLGYGLPIGGVLATEEAIIPYAVGVDIACRMMLTVYPASTELFNNKESAQYKLLTEALLNHTYFGYDQKGVHDGVVEHSILDPSHWEQTELTRSLRETAIRQIGTSGGGNHFVEWGELEITDSDSPLNLPPGRYLALLSHSGSRGVGFKIANYYTKLAMADMEDLDHSVRHLAWLSLDHDLGREYWDAMHLAGKFASANHHVIHTKIAKALDTSPIVTVENHHNFAWREKAVIDGKERDVIVHRKGATPAGKGVLGIIPGTMADPGYVVSGKGNFEALNSASHGSGRKMSRSKAKRSITPEQQREYLAKHGVDLIGGGLDEAPQAYKSIDSIMEEQKDLVDVLGCFRPKIVRMADE